MIPKIGNFGIHIWGMHAVNKLSLLVWTLIVKCKMMNNKFSKKSFGIIKCFFWAYFYWSFMILFQENLFLTILMQEIIIFGISTWGMKSIFHLSSLTLDIFRFEELASLTDGNLIVYVGANTDGADGVELMRKCPHWWENTTSLSLTIFSIFSASFTFLSQSQHLTKSSRRSGMVTRPPMAGMPQSTTLVWDQMTGEIEYI